MKNRPNAMLFRGILAAACLLAAFLFTSCAKQKPFSLEELTTVRPPGSVDVTPATELEGVRITIKWEPSPDDRFANKIITVGDEANAPNTKYHLKDLSDRPKDDRVKYPIYRAEVQPGEDVNSIPRERFKWIAAAKEGETQYEDKTTEPRLVLWQAVNREVKEIERKATKVKVDPEDPASKEIFADSRETKARLAVEAGNGFAPETSVNNANYYVLQRTVKMRVVPIFLRPDGSLDVVTQKALIDEEMHGWDVKGIIQSKKAAVFQKDGETTVMDLDTNVPKMELEKQMDRLKSEGWQQQEIQELNFLFSKKIAAEKELHKGKVYAYIVGFDYGLYHAESAPSMPVTTTAGVFGFEKLVNLILVIAFVMVAGYFIISAQRGKEMYIRPIAGIAAVEEAVGRATEMGRPALFCTGLGGVGGPATLASLAILSKIAEKTAEYQTELIMPNCDIFVLQIGMETIKEAYLRAGRPEAFSPDMAFFVSDRQFAFAAGVSGIMARRRPAAVFLLGSFYAEALLLAEAGANVGAIQIGGTDQDAQLPFFVTACDYTLIGEELYAAGAYLSHDPKLLGTLKGQDGFKAVVMALIIVIVPTVIILTIAGALQWTEFLKLLFGPEFLLM